MRLTDQVKGIRSRFIAQFPIPQGVAGTEIEERCRQWCINLASQIVFETGDTNWGVKRAGVGRPTSKDTIAHGNGELLIWDLISGAGTGAGTLVEDPDSVNVTGQIFVAVTAANLLTTPAPVPQPSPVPTGNLVDAINALTAAVNRLASKS